MERKCNLAVNELIRLHFCSCYCDWRLKCNYSLSVKKCIEVKTATFQISNDKIYSVTCVKVQQF